MCPENYATMAPGAALAAAGGAAALTSAVLFILDARRQRREALQAAVSPWLGPRGGGVSAMVGF
jgi:hypothetical protein